jgi:hypothetical protein
LIFTRFLSHAIAILWLILNSNLFLILMLAIPSWIITLLVCYGAWIVLWKVEMILEEVLRVILSMP